MSQKAAIVMAAKLTARLAALCALCFVTRCEAFAKPSSTRDCARLVSASGNVTVIGCGDTKDCTAIENVESKLALLNGELQKMVDTFQQLQPQRTKRVKAPRPREIAGHGSLQHVVSTSALSRPLPDATRPSSPKPSKTLVFLEEGSAYAYDTVAGAAALHDWFGRHVERPLAERGISVAIEAVRVENNASKPGPVFNALARQAQTRDADFFYRVNDDTLMVTPWASAFVCALCSFGPPYGVVGPVESIHISILTHDFVHRTHLAIFDDYYPPQLSDWWMDGWMSKVYGSTRSVMVARVKARTGRDEGWRKCTSRDAS